MFSHQNTDIKIKTRQCSKISLHTKYMTFRKTNNLPSVTPFTKNSFTKIRMICGIASRVYLGMGAREPGKVQ